MDVLYQEVRQIYASFLQRLTQLFSENNSRSVQVTGVLGLAAVLYSLYQIRNSYRSKRRREDLSTGRGSSFSSNQAGPSSSSAPGNSLGRKSDGKNHQQEAVKPQKGSSLQWAVKSRIAGLQAVTISAPGVLLEENTVQELEESATLRQEAGGVLREMACHTSLYIITQVSGDTGEATCRGALEAAGLVGTNKGQIPPQRLLFCSTLEGKASIVRQLEPQLHIDAHSKTIEDLKRFIRLVHICLPGQAKAGGNSQNVGSASSLLHMFS